MSSDNPKPGKTIVDQALLRDFVDGKLDSAMQVKVAAFIEQHPHLLAQVEAMSARGFVAKVRAAHREPAAVAVDESQVLNVESRPLEEFPTAPIPGIPAELENYAGYKIVRELGRGGMGIVYLAENVQLGGRREVLKVLNERLLAVPEAKERFKREIFAVSQLKHPSIVTAYSVLPLSTQLVFAMEFVDGKDLATLIREQQLLPIAVACSIIQQVAAGLHHGHENNLVHRDIKPSNIMVYRSGKKVGAKILDYGLAKPTNEKPTEGLTQDGVMMGTVEYIAPEQILSAAAADKLSDIYSLGCTLYHALAGRPPFGGTMRELMAAHWHTDAPFINMLRPEVPMELAVIVAKMMAKEPNKRFGSAIDVALALKPYWRAKQTIPRADSNLPGPIVESTHDTLGPVPKATLDTSVDGTEQPNNNVSASAPLADSSERESSPPLAHSYGGRPASPPLAHSYGRGVGGEGLPPQTATQPTSLAEPKKLPLRRNLKNKLWIALGCCLALFGLAWASGFIRIETPEGTLVIENLPTDAQVLVDGNQVDVTWDDNTSNATVTIAPGKHKIRLARLDETIEGPELTIESNEVANWKVPPDNSSPLKSESTNESHDQASRASVEIARQDFDKPEKRFPFLANSRSHKVSVREGMAYLEALNTSRKLTNGSFDKGFDGWILTGGAQRFDVSKGYLKSWGKGNVMDTGTLYQCFVVPENALNLNFKIAGGKDKEQYYVALSYRDKEVERETARNSNKFFAVSWRVKELRGAVLTLSLVDNGRNRGWEFISADDFRFTTESN